MDRFLFKLGVLLVAAVIIIVLCSTGPKTREYQVFTAYGEGFFVYASQFYCDSVLRYDDTHIRVFIDTSITDIYADRILILKN